MMRHLLLAIVFAGCFSPSVSETPACASDGTCPSGHLCVEGICVTSECGTAEEGTVCSTLGVPLGACHAGTCRAPGCGDGVSAAPERCDDGNNLDGDGCSADCMSVETCGNATIDYAVGEQCDDEHPELGADGCTAKCTFELGGWRDLRVPDGPTAREHVALAYDSKRHVVVMFGGRNGSGNLAETWEWHGGWKLRRPQHTPPARHAAMLAYDSIHERTILFGGSDGSPTPFPADTWSWDGRDWVEITTSPMPPSRYLAAMAFDRANQKTVLFGGFGTSANALSDTWTFDGTTWTNAAPSSHPVGGGAHGAYDATRNRVVVVNNGGHTWEWTGTTWSDIPSNSPTGPLVYDATRGKVVGVQPNQAMLAWNGSTWTQTPEGALPRDGFYAASYDEGFGIVVVVGGTTSGALASDVATLPSGATTWRLDATTLRPPSLNVPSAAYERRRGRVVMFGGIDATPTTHDDTWLLEGSAWFRLPTATQPPARWTSTLVEDSSGGLLLFGGISDNVTPNSVVFADTWRFANDTWTNLHPPSSPPARALHQSAYDEVHHRTIVFGGLALNGTSPVLRGDTWSWDGTSWSPIASTNQPAPVIGAAMFFDRKRGTVIMFGGITAITTEGFVLSKDMWELDGNQWTKLQPPTMAPTRYYPVSFVDPVRDRFVVSGGLGEDGVTLLDDTWEWDGTTWAQVLSIDEAGIRYGGAAAYDAVQRRAVTFGGFDGQVTDAFRSYEYAALDRTRESCTSIEDADGDGLVGCADPDCWGRCTPSCPPHAVGCTELAGCGDGSCNRALEDPDLCPQDCP